MLLMNIDPKYQLKEMLSLKRNQLGRVVIDEKLCNYLTLKDTRVTDGDGDM